MAVGRKRAVSLRISVSDLKKIKAVAERLDVRDSDVIRVALRLLLSRLSPIADNKIKGRQLVPMFLELWPELSRNFDLDVARLEAIVNDGVPESERVSVEDLHMIAMSGAPRAPDPSLPSYTALTSPAKIGNGRDSTVVERRRNTLKRYLYDKYLYPDGRSPGSSRRVED